MNETTVDQTKLQFWLSGVSERQRRLGEAIDDFRTRILDLGQRIMSALSERGPVDYNIRRDERRALTSVLRDLLKEMRSRPPPSMHNGDDSGSKRMLAWILTVTSLLAVGAIGGGIVMYGELASIKATVTQWQTSSDRRQDQMERRMDRLENRPQ